MEETDIFRKLLELGFTVGWVSYIERLLKRSLIIWSEVYHIDSILSQAWLKAAQLRQYRDTLIEAKRNEIDKALEEYKILGSTHRRKQPPSCQWIAAKHVHVFL